MNKQQIIEKAYGSVFSKVKLMIREYDGTIETFPDILNDEDFYWKTLGFTHAQIEDCYGDCEASRWRPISLKGIEDNNGWTKIESEDDFPKVEGEYTLMFTNQKHTDKIVDHIWFKSPDLLWKCTTHYRIKQQLPKPLY